MLITLKELSRLRGKLSDVDYDTLEKSAMAKGIRMGGILVNERSLPEPLQNRIKIALVLTKV